MSTPNQTLRIFSSPELGTPLLTIEEPMADPTETVMASVVSPIPTPTYGNRGLFCIQASVIINAPIDAVFDATTNVSNFPKWNTFVPRVVINTEPPSHEIAGLQPGTEMIFHVCMKGKDSATRPSTEIVTVVEDFSDGGRRGHRVAWKPKRMGLKAERVTEVREIFAGDPGVPKSAKTEYKTWETFGGPLAYVLRLALKDDLLKGFAGWATDLKKYCEKEEET